MIVRSCVRALLEATDGRFLLLRIVEPGSSKAFWITPGGGTEGDEDDETALRRELYEETGLETFNLGPPIWTRDFTFDWCGETYRQLERFFWVCCDPFDPRPTQLDGAVEAKSFDELRWWTVEEIAASNELFAPLDLAEQINRLRRLGANEVIVVGP